MTRRKPDFGLETVERVFRDMAIDEPWSVREARGFTWWGAWCRQRVWAEKAVRSDSETLWQVRARTPAFRDQPDEPATYALVNAMNALQPMSAYAFDPDDRTVSARCGAFVYEEIAPWLGRYVSMAVALQASLAWLGVPDAADGRPLDDDAHPTSGPRSDPDDMLSLAFRPPTEPSPFTPAVLRGVAAALAADGVAVSLDDEGKVLVVPVTVGQEPALWGITSTEHPILGPGALVRLMLPRRTGLVRGPWLANALNLAESSDWHGEHRPHALGAWASDAGRIVHAAFFPGILLGDIQDEVALLVIRNLLAWGAVRAMFAGERLPWLEAAASSRHPDDEPPEEDDATTEPATGAPAGDDGAADSAETAIPWSERSFGPASRTPRPRSASEERRTPRELVVDPCDPAAFAEIDDAVAAAEDGDRIRVRPGSYRKPVVVDRAVTIEGEGEVEMIVLEPVGGEALGFAASGARVGGLTIRPARAGNDGELWSAIAVHDVEATIIECDLTSHLGATVWVGGPSSRAVILGCSLSGGAQNAVWVVEEGRAEMAACRVAGNRWPIAVGGPGASLSLEDCEVVDNLADGIVALQGGTLRVERTEVRGNAGVGIAFYAAAPSSTVIDSTVTGNGGPGIVVRGGRGVRVARNRVTRNESGIVVDEGASPTIEANEVAGNAHVGIGVVGEGSDPIVTDNTIATGHASGIVVRRGGRGTYERNRLAAGDIAGIWVADPATCPTFRGNVVFGGTSAGVNVSDGAGGVFEGNDLRGNATGSWDLESPGDLRRSGNLEDTGRAIGDVVMPTRPGLDPEPATAGPRPGPTGPRLMN